VGEELGGEEPASKYLFIGSREACRLEGGVSSGFLVAVTDLTPYFPSPERRGETCVKVCTRQYRTSFIHPSPVYTQKRGRG